MQAAIISGSQLTPSSTRKRAFVFYHVRSVTVALLHINAGDCYNLRVKSVICQVERFNLTCREYAILFVFKSMFAIQTNYDE